MSYYVLIHDNVEAQVSQNTLKSISNRTNLNALTRAQIKVGEDPSFIAKYKDAVYVANTGSGTISVVDTYSNSVVKDIYVGKGPSFIKPFGAYIYVANTFSNTISVIDSTE